MISSSDHFIVLKLNIASLLKNASSHMTKMGICIEKIRVETQGECTEST